MAEPERRRRLLLVDDDASVLGASRELLDMLGYDVTAMTDPRRALERFAAEPRGFDVVVTDQTMPRMTGVQLAHAIGRLRPGMPIVVTTGYHEADVREHGESVAKIEVL